MKFSQLIEGKSNIEVIISSKGKLFNFIDNIRKRIDKGKGYELSIKGLEFPGMGFFWKDNSLYEITTGRKITSNLATKESITYLFQGLKGINYKEEYKKWLEDTLILNKNEYGIEGNIQKLKITKPISDSKQRLNEFKANVLNELKTELKKIGYSMSDERSFNLNMKVGSKKVKGYLLIGKLKHEYFFVLKFDQFKNYKVEVTIFEKTTGIFLQMEYGIGSFIFWIENSLKHKFDNEDFDKYKDEKYPLN